LSDGWRVTHAVASPAELAAQPDPAPAVRTVAVLTPTTPAVVLGSTQSEDVVDRARAALSRRAVFVRDGHRCQYCGANAENIDHIVPRSRGGEHVWENVVAACRPCNTRKEDRLLHEVGLVLRRKPMAPRELTWIVVAVGTVHPHWEPYLQPGAALSA